MAITLDEVFEMSTRFHAMVGIGKGDAAAHQATSIGKAARSAAVAGCSR